VSQQLERLKQRTETLERELASERERRAKVQAAFHRQRTESRRLYEECARLRTELEQGDHELPPPAWTDRKVNPALRTKWRWILRVFALLVMVIVLGAVYLVIHAYITHESLQHVWSQLHSPFWHSAAASGR
jgi:Flp pilus assembly protein TadB